MKKILLLLLALAMAFTLAACGGDDKKDGETTTDEVTPPVAMGELDFALINPAQYTVTEEITDTVKISVSYTDEDGFARSGEIYVRLFEKVAPKTVANFQTLVKNDFYNGTIFHRVYKGFMIQGGAPKSGSPDVSEIKGEFTSNGFTNNLKHIRGVISMARTNVPDSATSQFFIMHQNNSGLDGNYASFGYVVSGIEVVDGIAGTAVRANPYMNGEKSSPIHTVTIDDVSFVKPASN